MIAYTMLYIASVMLYVLRQVFVNIKGTELRFIGMHVPFLVNFTEINR